MYIWGNLFLGCSKVAIAVSIGLIPKQMFDSLTGQAGWFSIIIMLYIVPFLIPISLFIGIWGIIDIFGLFLGETTRDEKDKKVWNHYSIILLIIHKVFNFIIITGTITYLLFSNITKSIDISLQSTTISMNKGIIILIIGILLSIIGKIEAYKKYYSTIVILQATLIVVLLFFFLKTI